MPFSLIPGTPLPPTCCCHSFRTTRFPTPPPPCPFSRLPCLACAPPPAPPAALFARRLAALRATTSSACLAEEAHRSHHPCGSTGDMLNADTPSLSACATPPASPKAAANHMPTALRPAPAPPRWAESPANPCAGRGSVSLPGDAWFDDVECASRSAKRISAAARNADRSSGEGQ